MSQPTRLEWIRARIDRLPAAWVIVLVGFLLQLGLALWLFALESRDGDVWGTVFTGVFVGLVVVVGVAAAPAFVLLWLGRYRRVAAVIAVVVGVATLVVTEGYPFFWPFPAALFLAATRAWAGDLDAETLLRVDPGRFERVDPPENEGRGSGDEQPAEADRTGEDG